jgi:hypothetical protein
MYCTLEGIELFGSTKWKLDPPSVDCALHQLDKINYQISHPNIRAKRICIEEFLNYVKHDVAHIILVLNNDCLSSY